MNSHLVGFAIPGIALGVFVLISTSSSQQTNDEQVAHVDSAEINEVCADCHDDIWESLNGSAHRQSGLPGEKQLLCITCHGANAAAHAESPLSENIENPLKGSAASQRLNCSPCHQPHLQLDNAGFDPHTEQDIACADCHRIHTNSPSMLVDNQGQFCGKCHIAVTSEFNKRSSHPVLSEKAQCLDCHDFTGKKQPRFGHGDNANCRTCHQMQSGPFPHEHLAASSISTEGSGCTGCHEPHGSNNDRLLARTGRELCRHCHATPPAHFTAHGGIGASVDCMDCHSDIHGSFDNRFLLHPQLGTKLSGTPASCFCHGVNE